MTQDWPKLFYAAMWIHVWGHIDAFLSLMCLIIESKLAECWSQTQVLI